ncbi:MAG TPA: phage tail tape measure protein [Microvirga sp.]|jgi:hypothetical protein|nr:phage tail tape measure protein [Microvirga sp.]
MATDSTTATLILDAHDEATPIVRRLRRELRSLESTIKRTFGMSATTTAFAQSMKVAADHQFQNLAGLQAVAKARSADQRTTRKGTADTLQGERDTMRALRQRWTFERRMASQRTREDRQASQDRAKADAATMLGLRRRLDFESRMSAQRRREERDAQRAADRARSRGWTLARDAAGRGRSAVDDMTRGPARAGVVGAGATSAATASSIRTRMTADAAEARLSIFGEMTRPEIVQARRQWLDASAITNAMRPSVAIDAFTETLKSGIPRSAARAVTESIMGAAAGIDLDIGETTRLVGRLATVTQRPDSFNPEAIKKMLGDIGLVSAKTAADSRELVSSLRRGGGALAASKISVGDLAAFTGAGVSAGIQQGRAGTFFDFLVQEAVGARNQSGQRGRELEEAARALGFGSSENLSRRMATDTTASLLQVLSKMQKMNEMRRSEVADLLGMREWRGEILQLVSALPILQETLRALRDPANADFLDRARTTKLSSLEGRWNSATSAMSLMWERIGEAFDEVFVDAAKWVAAMGTKVDLGESIKAHVRALVEGVTEGLGFKDLRSMLDSMLGAGSAGSAASWKQNAKAFMEGVRSVVDTIRGILGMLPGGGDASTLAKLAGGAIALSFALRLLSPLVMVLTGLASGIVALARGLAAAKAFMGAGAAAGAAGTAAGAAARGGAAGALLRLFPWLAGSGAIGALVLDEARRRDPKGEAFGRNDDAARMRDEERRKAEDRRRLFGPDSDLYRRQSFDGPETTGAVLHRASLRFDDGADDFRRTVDKLGARVELAALVRSEGLSSSLSPSASAVRSVVPSIPLAASSIGSSVGSAFRASPGAIGPHVASIGPDVAQGFQARSPEAAGRYRPVYNVTDADLDQRVINTIAGEVSTRNGEGVDAVINNMINRVGSKGWGPSGNLLQVARAPGQYAGYRQASAKETAFIRDRIRAIASGGVPDNTGGANTYRAEWYYRQTRGRGKGYWADRAIMGPNVGGNRYAFEPGFKNGPFAPYAVPKDAATLAPPKPVTTPLDPDRFTRDVPSMDVITNGVPIGPPRGNPDGWVQNNAAPSVVNHITVSGATQTPEELASVLNRRIGESLNWRTHDVEIGLA